MKQTAIRCGLASLLILITLTCVLLPLEPQAVDEDADYVKTWTEIRATKLEDDSKFKDENTRWASLTVRLQDTFYKAVENHEPRSFCKYYVSLFGKHGADADLRWVLAANPASLVNRDRQPIRAHGKMAKYPHAQMAISEALVPRLLAEPDLRQRYWELVLYSRSLLRNDPTDTGSLFGIAIAAVQDGFAKGDKTDYWYYARLFMVLAHATSWDDSLKEYKADDLASAYRAWRKWFDENEVYLVADQEKHRWRLDESAKSKRIKTNAHEELPSLKNLEFPFSDWGKTQSNSSSSPSSEPYVWPKPPSPQIMRFERPE